MSAKLPEIRRHSLAGDAEGAIALLQERLSEHPSDAAAHSALLLLMHYNTDDPQVLYEEHRRWAARHDRPHSDRAFANVPGTGRRLRIGYLSGDLVDGHPVSFFMDPILRAHDHERFFVACYSNAPADHRTDRFRPLADHWVEIRGMSDGAAAEKIRADGIDILVDLGGHSGSGRALLLTRRAAPVQVTWLGYPDTTGLDSVDYRITDSMSDPEGVTERYHSEALVRLPPGFLCFQPAAESPDVSALPAWFAGHVTFGCFQYPGKITREAIALWARILKRMPTARLMLHHCFSDYADPHGTVRSRISDEFRKHDIGADRLQFVGFLRALRHHLEIYAQVDLSLDTFPYNGTTTTCESLWMGLPVVTLEGAFHAARVGTSILTRTGLTECITKTPDEYVERAVSLASNLDRLAAIRASTRGWLQKSTLMQGELFTRSLEEAYIGMWERWSTERAA